MSSVASWAAARTASAATVVSVDGKCIHLPQQRSEPCMHLLSRDYRTPQVPQGDYGLEGVCGREMTQRMLSDVAGQPRLGQVGGGGYLPSRREAAHYHSSRGGQTAKVDGTEVQLYNYTSLCYYVPMLTDNAKAAQTPGSSHEL